jgi:hypothetical protein
MPRDNKKIKIVNVRQHPRHVPVSKKNPDGITIVDQHKRHIEGKYLDQKMIADIFKSYDKKNILYPAKNKLGFPNENDFDDYIAVWCDYFNKKLGLTIPLDPDILKALIASESGFNPKAKNKNAIGLTQITKSTLKILQDLDGEAKDFVFKDISQKDLLDPNISVSLAARWLAYKQTYANKFLKRTATPDEVIQVYKGILNDKSDTAKGQIENFREKYGKIKK